MLKARPRPRREMSPGPWIVLIVIIIITASAYWWFFERPLGEGAVVLPADPGTSAPTAQPASAQPAGTQPVAAQTSGEESADTAIDTEVGDSLQPTVEDVDDADVADSVDEQDAVEPAAPDDGRLRVLLTFSGDCWTEISDGTGRRLFFGLGSDGRTVELSGQAPINALFGNADNVRIEVNGEAYAIRPEQRRGRTARLTIAGS